MRYCRDRQSSIKQLWVIDSMPGPTKHHNAIQALAVLEFLKTVPKHYKSREEFISMAVATGQRSGVATWLAMNLKRNETGFELAIDLDAIEAMMRDYGVQDFWPDLEAPAKSMRRDIVIAGNSTTFAKEERERVFGAQEQGYLHAHLLENCGHWVHAEQPDALLELLSRYSV
ncbi:MAG: hypothetical protein IPJ88_17360 [Myxococcales bacterium]|nr:MAG: hypothetical protein IPJ88_17360 [Myxococcales bacterium]